MPYCQKGCPLQTQRRRGPRRQTDAATGDARMTRGKPGESQENRT